MVAVLVVIVTFRLQMRNVETRAAFQADAVISQMLATRAVYTEDVLTKVAFAESPIDEVTMVDSASIPLPATLVHLISANINDQGRYSIDLISPCQSIQRKALDPAGRKRRSWR